MEFKRNSTKPLSMKLAALVRLRLGSRPVQLGSSGDQVVQRWLDECFLFFEKRNGYWTYVQTRAGRGQQKVPRKQMLRSQQRSRVPPLRRTGS